MVWNIWEELIWGNCYVSSCHKTCSWLWNPEQLADWNTASSTWERKTIGGICPLWRAPAFVFLILDVSSLLATTKWGTECSTEPLIPAEFPSSRNVLSRAGCGTFIRYARSQAVKSSRKMRSWHPAGVGFPSEGLMGGFFIPSPQSLEHLFLSYSLFKIAQHLLGQPVGQPVVHSHFAGHILDILQLRDLH